MDAEGKLGTKRCKRFSAVIVDNTFKARHALAAMSVQVLVIYILAAYILCVEYVPTSASSQMRSVSFSEKMIRFDC